MDVYLSLPDAAARARVDQSVILRAIESGKIKAAILSNGDYIVNQNDLNRPLRKEDTPEYQAFKHLRGIGIGIRQAAKKYNVNDVTMFRWVKNGYINRISGETQRGKRVLIDEADAAYCAAIYHLNPGQGKRLFNPDGTPYKSK